MSNSDDDLTLLLNRLGGGQEGAEDQILDRLYTELRSLAGGHMRGGGAHTLQPTALVHEAWMKLVQADALKFQSRGHFYRLASQAMRSVLVDHYRARNREKRGGDRMRLSLVPEAEAEDADAVDVLQLDETLQRLHDRDEELARIVEMRFYGGLSLPEIADALNVPLRTLERRWKLARAWLHAELNS